MEELEAWSISEDGDLNFEYREAQNVHDDVGTCMLVRDWPEGCRGGPRAVEASVTISAETPKCEAGIVLFSSSSEEEFVKFHFCNSELTLSKCSLGVQEIVSSQEFKSRSGSKKVELVLRLEVGGADDDGVAAVLDMGHCLRVVGRLPSFKCGRQVGISTSGSAKDRIEFKDFRLITIAPERHQFIGTTAEPAAATAGGDTDEASQLGEGVAFVSLNNAGAGVSGLGSSWTFSSDLSPDQLAEVKSLVGAAGQESTVAQLSGGAGPSGDGFADTGKGYAVLGPGGSGRMVSGFVDTGRGYAVLGGGDSSEAEATFMSALTAAAHGPDPEQARQRCLQQIEGLHVFLEEWFNAKVNREASQLQRLSGVLDPDFQMITAAGDRHDADGLAQLIDVAHGCTQEQHRFSIRIHDVQLLQIINSRPATYLVTYEEWNFQDRPGEKLSKKVCTALLRETSSAVPNAGGSGLPLLLHIHEVSLPDSRVPDA